MPPVAVQVPQGGRIVIPVKMRLQQARSLVKRYAQTDASVVDALIRERRQAAADE